MATTLRILSAGAAQAVTERIIDEWKRDTGGEVVSDFGAVGAMKARVMSGEAVDVIILTRAMIDELVASGVVDRASPVDLGTVGTGVAVRAGSRAPDVSNAESLRETILAARKIVCPDPAIATAGKVVMSLMEKLVVRDATEKRMQFFPNGYAAMKWLAADGGENDLGITQVTEILPNKGVRYVGPLPDAFQMKAVYTAGVASKGASVTAAAGFVKRFSAPAARTLLKEAGYEI